MTTDYGMLMEMIESASSMLGSLFYAMAVEKMFGPDGSLFMIIAAVLALLGVFFCFFGYRFRRIVGAFAWAVVAFTISGMVTGPSGLDSTVQILIAIVVGVVVGALCFRFQKVGTFLFCFLSAGGLFLLLTLSPLDFIMGFSLSVFTPALLVGLVYAIAAMKWTKPLMILATAAFGGVMAGLGVALLMNVTSFGTCQTIMIVAVAAGAVFQWVQSKPKAAAVPTQPGAAPVQQPVQPIQQPVQQPAQPIQTTQPAQPQAPAAQSVQPAQNAGQPQQGGLQDPVDPLFDGQDKQ